MEDSCTPFRTDPYTDELSEEKTFQVAYFLLTFNSWCRLQQKVIVYPLLL